MALKIQNTRELVSPDKLKLKIFVFALHGAGKTTFMASAPDLGVGVCETGLGNGLMSVAHRGIDYARLHDYSDFEAFCSGAIFKEKASLGLDSLSWGMKTFVKDKALTVPRAKGESAKRLLGIPELDDYGSIAEIARKNITKLIDIDKHIIVTAGLRIDKPDENNPTGETLIGPDVAGQMFLGSTAMFDLVLCLRTRSVLRDPKDPKSRYTQRFFVTENTNGIIAKNRLSISDKGLSFLPPEVIYDPANGIGDFNWFLKEATDKYAQYFEQQKSKEVAAPPARTLLGVGV